MQSELPKISVIILLYNVKKYLPFCFKSLDNQTFKDFEILVIDNGSIDESLKWMKEFKPHIKVVRHAQNSGFAKGNNQGVHWTKGEYVFFLNTDVILGPDVLEKLSSFLSLHDGAACAVPKSYKWNFKSVAEEYGITHDSHLDPNTIGAIPGKTDVIDSLGLVIYKSLRVAELGAGKKDEEVISSEPVEIFGPSASSLLIKRKALEDVAMLKSDLSLEFFDEDFFMYKEDIDLAFRLRLKGWKTYLVPSAHAYHDRTAYQKGASILKNRKNKSVFVNVHSYKNHWFFLIKNIRFSLFARNIFPIVLYELKKFIYICIFEQSTLTALKEIFNKFSKMKNKRVKILKNCKSVNADIIKWMN